MNDYRNARGLGRGLSALLADTNMQDFSQAEVKNARETLPIEFLEANPDQPRKHFDREELLELSQSIGENGVIQPILVRKVAEDRYQIVAGERRWRAATMAKLHNVPVVIREYSDNDVAAIALIENIQRSNLNSIEEAKGYEELMRRGSTQEEVSKVTGKSRSHIANMQRILKLNTEVQEMLVEGKISFGHAKVLASSENQLEDANWVVLNKASVRELERRIDGERNEIGKTKKPARHIRVSKDADTRQLEQDLHANLGMQVSINHSDAGKGKLTISYQDLDELDRLCQLLG